MSELKRRLRERSEHYLLQESVARLGKGAPGTVKPYRGSDGLFWRFVFVPLYKRVPWSVKKQAMERLRMTAQGWTPPPLEPSEPWTPPERR
jgi:hypothetical protein